MEYSDEVWKQNLTDCIASREAIKADLLDLLDALERGEPDEWRRKEGAKVRKLLGKNQAALDHLLRLRERGELA